LAGTADAINMVESGAAEVSEEDMLAALLFGHQAIQTLVQFQNKIAQEIGKEKMEVTLLQNDEELVQEINAEYKEKMKQAIQTYDKLEREENMSAVKKEIVAVYTEKLAENPEKEI